MRGPRPARLPPSAIVAGAWGPRRAPGGVAGRGGPPASSRRARSPARPAPTQPARRSRAPKVRPTRAASRHRARRAARHPTRSARPSPSADTARRPPRAPARPRTRSLQRSGVVVHDGVENRDARRAVERPRPGEHLVEHHPEREDVRPHVQAASPIACSGDMYSGVPMMRPSSAVTSVSVFATRRRGRSAAGSTPPWRARSRGASRPRPG